MPFRILIALGGTIAAALVTLIYPFIGVLILVFLNFGRPQDGRPNIATLHIPMIMLVAVIAGTIMRAKDVRGRFLQAIKSLWMMLGIYALMLLSALANNWTPYSRMRLDEFGTVVTFCIVTYAWLNSPQRLRGYLTALLFSGAYIISLALRNPSMMHEEIGNQKFARITLREGSFGGSNYLALFMVITIFLALPLFSHFKLWWQRVLLTMIVLSAGFVFFRANSRGASIALAVGLLFLWMLQKKKAVSAALGVVVLVAFVALAPDAYWERLSTVKSYEKDASATSRLEYWGIAADLISSHPLFGVGPDNFILYADNTPHQAYLQMGCEVGIPALLLYISWILTGMKNAFMAQRKAALKGAVFLKAASQGLFCCVMAVCVQGFTTGLAHREVAYVFVAASFCVRQLAEVEEPQLDAELTAPSSDAIALENAHGIS